MAGTEEEGVLLAEAAAAQEVGPVASGVGYVVMGAAEEEKVGGWVALVA